LPICCHEAKERAQRAHFAWLVMMHSGGVIAATAARRNRWSIMQGIDRAAVKSRSEIQCTAARQIVP
jgi:hypothetical protein